LAGCGFKPVYDTAYDTGATSDAAAVNLNYIAVDPIPDRVGYRMRAELARLLAPLRTPVRYRLDVSLESDYRVTAIDKDASTRRRNLELTAVIRLFPTAGMPDEEPQPLYLDRLRSDTGVEQLPSDFATLVAEEEAERRLAEQLAWRIRQRLALFFAQNPQP